MMSGRKFSNLRAFNLWLFAPVPLETRFPVTNETVDHHQQGKKVFVILVFIFHTTNANGGASHVTLKL